MKYAIEIKSLVKSYKSKGKIFKAVKGINFKIKEGEVFGLLGPNGAGKTTTINMITGVLSKDSGSIKIFGKEFSENKEEIKNMMNVSSAYHSLTTSLSLYENLNVYARLYGIKNRKNRIKELLKQFELGDIKDKLITGISSGEKTRVALCKALLNHPKILLLDECTVGLDPDIAEKTRRYIEEYKKKHKVTIIFTSHYMYEVEELCDKIAFMKNGKILKIDTAKNLKKSIKEQVVELSLVKKSPKLKKILSEKGLNLIESKPNLAIFEIDIKKHNIGNLIADIINKGVEIKDIHIKKPTLDDIFIKISRGK